MSSETLDNFKKFVKKEKGRRRLHTVAEERLSALLSRLAPESCAVREVSGVLGGRNDLIQFHFDGRRIVFELFFSPGQVPQDLRLLEQAEAEVKIAVLLDREIDPGVSTQYFRKKPDHFPYLWLSTVLIPRHETFCLARLAELTSEDSAVRRVRRILSDPVGRALERPLNDRLQRVEAELARRRGEEPGAISPKYNREVVALRVVAKVLDMGVPVDRLRSLYAWLSDEETMRWAFTLVVLGIQAFLVTDLDGRHAIWSDGDLADDVILGAEDRRRANLIMCLNPFVNDVLQEAGAEKSALRYHFVHTYAEHVREIKWAWGAEEDERSLPEDRSA